MRRYYLENESRERYSFLDVENGILAKDCLGHGFSYSSDYSKVGDMFVSNYIEDQQGEMNFTIQFLGTDKFKKYAQFCNFVNAAEKLYLIYIPYDDLEYKRDVDVTSVEDNGIKDNIYSVKLKLLCKSMFYSTASSDYVVTAETAGMTFDFVWSTWFNDYSNIMCEIENDGHVEAAIQIEFGGYVVNPKLQVFVGNEIIHEITFPVPVLAGEKMRYSTLDDDLYIMIEKKDGSTQNLIEFLSIENENFFKLPKGNSSIMFTCENGSLDEIHVKLFKYYKAV